MTLSYTREERLVLERARASGAALTCPVCGAPVNAQPVAAPAAVSYVRRRIWLVCTQCKRTTSIDAQR